MSVSAINQVVQQMQAMAAQAGASASTQQAPQSFAAELAHSLSELNTLRNQATQLAERFTLGEPGIGLDDVMVNMQKASVALNMGVQVRNRLVAAYQEIMSMQV